MLTNISSIQAPLLYASPTAQPPVPRTPSGRELQDTAGPRTWFSPASSCLTLAPT